MKYTPFAQDWMARAIAGPAPEEIAGSTLPATVPGCIHTDLLAAGLIPDPFDGDNETLLQWIGRCDWEYTIDFAWTPDGEDRHDLVCEGLDTVATIELNGVEVARTINQHRTYRFDVREQLVDGDNTLRIRFESPVDYAERVELELGSRVHANHHPYNAIRKTASNFGWDWGIDVATVGIWKAIGIESWSTVRIASVRPLVDVAGTTGVLDAHVELEWDVPAEPVEVVVSVADQRVVVEAATGSTALTARIEVPDADLWWPRGHGDQPLYPVSVELGEDLDAWSGRVGFRTIEVDTRADVAGSRFEFLVNGERIYVYGANWIPDDAFITRVDRARYAARITDAVEANVNLLRVWGGGIYESEDFYDLCDEAGILVWQDFLFACAAYSEDEQLYEEVEAEARDAITRLSAHASLAIWNGNNENVWLYVDNHWRPRLDGATWGNGYYRELLPSLVAELDPGRAYCAASPYSFSDYVHPNDENNGTMHIWDVWNRRDYRAYRDYRPRFVSEFGFQGPPAWSTLTSVVHDEPLEPFGRQMLIHQKANHGNRKLESGLLGHFPTPTTVEDWHWATQLNQAHAIRFGIEHFRSLVPHNTGQIVWQLNDNWPVVSWAAVDYAGQRKPLWYVLRDAYAPRLATVQPSGDDLDLVVLNDTDEPVRTTAHVRRVGFEGSVNAEAHLEVELAARSADRIRIPAALSRSGQPQVEVLVVDLGEGFARAVHLWSEVVDQWLDPSPLVVEAVEGPAVIVTATSYARDVTLMADLVDASSRVDSALVDLLPGESHRFEITSDADARLFVATVRTANALVRAARTLAG
jgi:beta-mannosidase